MLETSNFVHESAMQSLSLVMSECFVSGRGQGHVSNFYIADVENFATASRRYTGLSCGVVCVILCLAVLVEFRLVSDTDRYRHRHRHMASTADA